MAALIQRGVAAAERIYAFMDVTPTILAPATSRRVARPHKMLSLESVSFHYQEDEPVLEDVNMQVPHGETIAIVGANGCGKSTLASLVPRFYDPTQGAVTLDGVDLRAMGIRDLRDRVGLVMQQPYLFNDTVANNIRYGSLEATDADVIAAAKKAYAHRFVAEKLSLGYETRVGEGGSRLSGGQRQRIALARAMLRDPDILILDEATSQIDLESEKLIHQALEQFVRGRTSIIITHRLTTALLADRIVVMQAGRIVDIGSHDELTRRCGLYGRLSDSQARLSA